MSDKRKKFERLLLSSVSNLAMSFADSYIEKNVERRASAGLKATVIRRQLGKCCEWCQNLAGIYTADKLPADIYKRHANCRCMVTYKTEKVYTDAWSKKQFATEKEARLEREKEIKAEAAKREAEQKELRLELDRKVRTSRSEENIERQRQEMLEKEKELLKEMELKRSRNFKTVEELRTISESEVLNIKTYSEVQNYFEESYKITVEGFGNKDLEMVKITLSGVDDFIKEFPDTVYGINKIVYNKSLKNYGKMSSDKLQSIGNKGVGSYGTGVHETAHALDYARSSLGTNDYSESIVGQARKNLKLRKNSKAYEKAISPLVGMSYKMDKIDHEVFAYAMESKFGNNSNKFADEVYRLTKGD